MAQPINDTALHSRLRAAIAAGKPVTGPRAASIWHGVLGVSGRGPSVDEIAATISFCGASTPIQQPAPVVPLPAKSDGADIIALARRVGLHGVSPAVEPDSETQAADADGADIIALARSVGLAGFAR